MLCSQLITLRVMVILHQLSVTYHHILLWWILGKKKKRTKCLISVEIGVQRANLQGRSCHNFSSFFLKVFRLENSLCLYTMHGHEGSVTALCLDKVSAETVTL